MKEIKSTKNEQIKRDHLLLFKKGRNNQKRFLIEGEKLINEAIKADFILETVYFVNDLSEKYVDLISKISCEKVVVSEQVLRRLTDAKTSQGIVATAKIHNVNNINKYKRALILENLQDPKNVGAMLRTASATNFIDIYLINSADPYSAKAVRASMSGIFKVNLHFCTLEECEKALKGYQIICGDMNGENLFDSDIESEKVAVAVGNEGNGVSKDLVQYATKTISIPMDNELESLNVAVSGSILMYEIRRKNRR